MLPAAVRCFTSRSLRARRLLAALGVMLVPSCIVYTPDLLSDDAVSIGGGSNPTASPSPRPSPALPTAASPTPNRQGPSSQQFLAAPRVNPATDSVELASPAANAPLTDTELADAEVTDGGTDETAPEGPDAAD